MVLNPKARRGFTLVELLVVMAIIATLAGLLLPALSSARSSANASASANNLSTFGRGFEVYASTHDGNYSSGAFDHFRDGDVRRNGWVGDLIGTKVANPGKSLDPAHRNKLSATVGDYTGAITANQGNLAAEGIPAGRWDASATATGAVGTGNFGGAPQSRDLWDEGYNTNFVTTWHFSRGDPTDAGGYAAGGKGLDDGDGPLSQNIVSQARTTAARIALMAPARAIAGASGLIDAAAAAEIKSFTGSGIAKANDRMTASFTDGMVVPFTDATMGGSAGEFVHDLSGIYPLHQPKTADGTGGFAPVLFADLHVEKIADTVSDGSTSTGDGFIGNNLTGYSLDGPMYEEASDLIWLKRLRNPQ
jgi:prepilin-type N-terminal cleavage/methylation domain-containing protein